MPDQLQKAIDDYHALMVRDLDAADEQVAALRAAGHVSERDVTQLFDAEAGVFLADRFVKGDCPRCSTPDQYGDNCDACGATYTPDELGCESSP